MSFAVRTCVADTLTSSLCDALMDRGDSASVLAALARDGLVIPVDRTGERHRYHRLVRETLRAELRREPELESDLHRRASAWHRSVADVDRAVLHSLAAGDVRVEFNLARAEDPHNLWLVREDGTGTAHFFDEEPSGAVVARTLPLTRGRWKLFCSLNGHEAAGMRATLTVN